MINGDSGQIILQPGSPSPSCPRTQLAQLPSVCSLSFSLKFCAFFKSHLLQAAFPSNSDYALLPFSHPLGLTPPHYSSEKISCASLRQGLSRTHLSSPPQCTEPSLVWGEQQQSQRLKSLVLAESAPVCSMQASIPRRGTVCARPQYTHVHSHTCAHAHTHTHTHTMLMPWLRQSQAVSPRRIPHSH